MFHLARLVGVGKESINALARKDSCPTGRPNISHFYTGVASSDMMVSKTLLCICRPTKFEFHSEQWAVRSFL